MNKPFAVISLLSVSFFSGCLSAQVYRWIDDQGQVVFSQSPPQGGRDATSVTLPPDPPAESREQAREQLDEQIKQLDEAEGKRKLQQEAAAKKQADKNYARQQCANARENLEIINNRPPQTLFQRTDGSYMRLTAEERAEQIRQATDIVNKYCR